MDIFDNQFINRKLLSERSFNYRWAELEEGVIPLTAADIDYPIAEVIQKSIIDYTKKGIFNYGPKEGLIEFKESVRNWYLKTKDISVNSSHVFVFNAAAQALFSSVKSCVSQGTKVIIPNPVDFLFRTSVEACGGEVIPLDVNFDNASFNLEELEMSMKEAEVLMICNPNNPLGKCMEERSLTKLAELAKKHQLIVISDEVWGDIDYEGKFKSFLHYSRMFDGQSIIVSGLSKNFGLAGLRVGYTISENEELNNKILINSNVSKTINGVSTLSQIAATSAFNEGDQWFDQFLNHLKKNRDYLQQRLSSSNLFEVNHPDSTYLFFLKLKEVGFTSEEFCKWSMENAKVAFVPGGKNWFESNSENHIRISYATSQELLKEALDRVEETFKQR